MKVTFYIDTNREVIIEKFRGDATLASIAKSFPHIWNHPDYSPHYDGIIDFRECKLLFSATELNQMTQQIAENKKRMRGRAAVLVSEPMEAAIGAIYSEKMKEVHSAVIFCSNSEVMHYLNIDSGIFDEINRPEAVHLTIE